MTADFQLEFSVAIFLADLVFDTGSENQGGHRFLAVTQELDLDIHLV